MLRRILSLLLCAARRWSRDSASTAGAALAFYCAFSLAPLLVILLSVAGAIVGTDAAYSHIGTQLRALFGPATAKVLLGAVESSKHAKGVVATVISIGTLVLGATTVLAALETALEQIWGTARIAPTGVRGWIRTRLLSFGFILTLVFLLLVSLSVTTALSALRGWISARYTGFVLLIGAADAVFSLSLITALFALVYRYMPARRLPWKTVLVGGLLTGVLFNLGRWLIGLYLAHSTQPSAFGAAASFAALLLWLYYTAQIFLYSAEFTSCLGGLREESVSRSTDRSGCVRSVRNVIE